MPGAENEYFSHVHFHVQFKTFHIGLHTSVKKEGNIFWLREESKALRTQCCELDESVVPDTSKSLEHGLKCSLNANLAKEHEMRSSRTHVHVMELRQQYDDFLIFEASFEIMCENYLFAIEFCPTLWTEGEV